MTTAAAAGRSLFDRQNARVSCEMRTGRERGKICRTSRRFCRSLRRALCRSFPTPPVFSTTATVFCRRAPDASTCVGPSSICISPSNRNPAPDRGTRNNPQTLPRGSTFMKSTVLTLSPFSSNRQIQPIFTYNLQLGII